MSIANGLITMEGLELSKEPMRLVDRQQSDEWILPGMALSSAGAEGRNYYKGRILRVENRLAVHLR